jgi:hypothetical protein
MHVQGYFGWAKGAELLTPLPILAEGDPDIAQMGCHFGGDEMSQRQFAASTEWHIENMDEAIALIDGGRLRVTVSPDYEGFGPNTNADNLAVLRANLVLTRRIMSENHGAKRQYRSAR